MCRKKRTGDIILGKYVYIFIHICAYFALSGSYIRVYAHIQCIICYILHPSFLYYLRPVSLQLVATSLNCFLAVKFAVVAAVSRLTGEATVGARKVRSAAGFRADFCLRVQ